MLKKIFNFIGNKNEECFKGHNPNSNIYICTIQKSGSTWLDHVFRDQRILKHTGFNIYTYQEIPNKVQNSTVPIIPINSIASRLYLDYSTYNKIIKPNTYKTIYLMRDPRDIVVSWYYSVKHSHSPIGEIPKIRKKLNALNEEDGLSYSINFINNYGIFEAQRSWICAEKDDRNIKIFKYEQLISDEIEVFRKIFDHCNINMDEKKIISLIKDYNFNNLAGRDRGNEDINSHYRKGVAGDWKNHFTPSLLRLFKSKTNDLVVDQGYEIDINWEAAFSLKSKR